MVNHDQIKRGLSRYIDSEIIPKLQVGSVKKVIVGTAAALMLQNLDKSIKSLSEHPLVGALGIVDESGLIDADKLIEAAKKNVDECGFKISLDILGMHLGDMTFKRSDLDQLRSYIG